MEVFGDNCDYKVSVAGYTGIDLGIKVGTLTCSKLGTASCTEETSKEDPIVRAGHRRRS